MLVAPDASLLRNWFVPDRPGPLVGLHVLNTGHGRCLVDRWPEPRCVLAQTADNYELVGDPDAVSADELQSALAGFVAVDERFDPRLRQAFPALVVWPRIIQVLDGLPAVGPLSPGTEVRRLDVADAARLDKLSDDLVWVAKTWGGSVGLAASGFGWGAFADEQLVAIACSFFVGDNYEDVGVITEAAFRGRGLSVACAAGLTRDIAGRGRRASWTTSPENHASLRVADKLGFVQQRKDRLLVCGRAIPEPARHREAPTHGLD